MRSVLHLIDHCIVVPPKLLRRECIVQCSISHKWQVTKASIQHTDMSRGAVLCLFINLN